MSLEFESFLSTIGMVVGLWTLFWFLRWVIPPQLEEYREMYRDMIQRRMFKAKEERDREEGRT